MYAIRWLTLICVLALLGASGPVLAEEECRLDPMDEALRDEIQILNLVNGMELTQEQVAQILDNARAHQAFQQQTLERIQQIQLAGRETMEKLRTTLINGGKADEGLAQQVHMYSGQGHELMFQLHKKRQELAAATAAVLTENQIALLAEYQPCLIPPKTRDTSSIGAPAGGNLQMISEQLARYRRIPEFVYERNQETLFDRVCEQIEKRTFQPVTEPERSDLLAVVAEARSLSDVEFEARKEDLARRFLIHKDPEKEAFRNQLMQTERVTRFLHSKGAVKVLEEKLAVLASN